MLAEYLSGSHLCAQGYSYIQEAQAAESNSERL